jgi:Tol biopolymer transport system component
MVGRPAWSPDGAVIAFLDAQTRVLQALDVKSEVLTPLALLYDGPDGSIRPPIVTRGGPAWSPDRSRVAFICWDGEGDELCITDKDGTARQQVTTLGRAEGGAGGTARSSVTGFAWSPDGAAIAVTVQAEQKGATAGIFRIELTARSGRRLTNVTVNAPLVWEEATDDLLYSATVEGRSDVYRLPATGGKPAAVTSALADGAREPTVSASGVLAAVSGNRIAVMRPKSDDVEFRDVSGLACAAPALDNDGGNLAFLALPRPIEAYP